MDSFSVVSLTSLTSSISHRTVSSTEEIKELIETLNLEYAAIPQLAAVSTSLADLHGRVVQLGESLNGSSSISQRLQTHLSQSLGSCDGITAVLNKQVMRLQADTLATLNPLFLTAYAEALTAYGRLFHFFVNLLSMSSRAEQDTGLDASEGQDILQRAESASQRATQVREILQDGNSTGTIASSSKGPFPGDVEPPPYEPAISPSGSCGESSSSPFAKSLSSLTQSFKAFASGFKAKPDPLVTAFCQAALRGEVQQMSGFLAQGTNINGRNEEGNTPLSCAILANQTEAIRFLLGAGADFNSWDWSKMPPLFLAASVGNIQVAQILLEKGAKINEKSWSGQPFFADVVAGENLGGIAFLLENGVDANTTASSGRPVIVQPVKKGNIELVKLLLKHGANVNSNDISGNSLLALAANQDNLQMARLLLNEGANPNSRTITGTTVFADQVSKRRLDFALELLERGADGDCRDIYGQKIIVTVIKDSKISDLDKIRFIRPLLAKGADANATDITWHVPALCHAMELNNSELVELLLTHKAKTKKKMSSGETLLLYAIDKGRTEQARLLLQYGALPNEADKKGRTPLLQAIAKQNLELIRILRRYGADTSLGGAISPAELAASLGRPEIFEHLGLTPPSTLTPGPAIQNHTPDRPESPPPYGA
ncbi:Fc.00g093450.m01.CDS01 [Cosmosporella sp. VM-42]